MQSLTSFFYIYRSNLSTDRRLLWQQLINLRLSIQGPWLAAGSYGGFEETRSRSLVRSYSEISRSAKLNTCKKKERLPPTTVAAGTLSLSLSTPTPSPFGFYRK